MSTAHAAQIQNDLLIDQLGDLPDFVFDINDRPVRLTGESWVLNALSNMDTLQWCEMARVLDPEAVFAAKHWIAESIQTSSVESVKNRFRGLVRALDALEVEPLPLAWFSYSTFLRVRDALLPLGSLLHYFNYVRGFYYWATDAGVPGTSFRTASKLEQIQIRNPIAQEAVMTWDPEAGPLNDVETALIERTISGISEPDFDAAATMLCYELGPNALNACLLEARDLHHFSAGTDAMWQLDVPRIKKRGKTRAAVRRRPISAKLGAFLKSLVDERAKALGTDPCRPIFCRDSARQSWVGTPREPLAFHRTPTEFTFMVKRFAHRHDLVSPRTGELMILSPRRFRYSYAQRMAEMGVPSMELSMLLDHSDERTVATYYKNSSKVADRIEKAIEKTAGPIMQWFIGGSPKDRIKTEFEVRGDMQTKSVGGLGQCGASLHCGLRPPYSCYQCAKFQPWADAHVHGAFLTEVRLEQQRLREFAANNPAYPVPTALDSIAKAAEELIARLAKGSHA